MLGASAASKLVSSMSSRSVSNRTGTSKLKLAVIGADYLVFRNGKTTVGPIVLGSAELADLRRRVETAIYLTAAREVSLRGEDFASALVLVDAILEARRAA